MERDEKKIQRSTRIIYGALLVLMIIGFIAAYNSTRGDAEREEQRQLMEDFRNIKATQEAEGKPNSQYTVGMAISRCEDEVNNTLNVNADFEGAFRIGAAGRSEELPNDRFRIKSWYDTGDGVERRYTCVISFMSANDYGAVVSDGW